MKYSHRPPKLNYEQSCAIRAYLDAHKWLGARALMCRKYGVRHETIARIMNGSYSSLMGQKTGVA